MSRYGVPFVKGPEVRLEPHARSCELSEVADLAKSLRKPLAIDLFCGAGGLSYGLHLAGFEVILAVDKDPEAVSTHRAYFPGASIQADLADQSVLDSICKALEGIQLDLVAGGPPCQPYSQAAFSKVRHLEEHHGKKPDPRRGLWKSFMYVVRKTQPRAVLVENVPDMAFGRDGIVLRRLVCDLEEAGYVVHTRVLCSDAYGVPQHRQRLFTVAFRENVEFSWPSKDESAQRVLKDAIGDLPPVEGGDKQAVRPYTSVPSPLQRYYRETLPLEDRRVIYDHYTRAVRKDDLEAFKLMTHKTTYRELPSHLKRYRDDIFEDKYKRLDMNQLSRTITAHISQDGYWYIHPTQHRTLTIREAARIQTFPDSYRFCGFPRHAFKQIGEAVPPLFGRAVGLAVLAAIESSRPAESSLITRDLCKILESWFAGLEPLTMRRPWLKCEDVWCRIMGQILFERAAPSKVASAYGTTLRRWPTPEALLEDKASDDYADGLFKFEHYESLRLLAKALASGSKLTADLLSECGIMPGTTLRLSAIAGIGTRRPLNVALERLVRRFTGIAPRTEDGKGNAEMLLGRMVGCDPHGTAFRALNEISAKYCGASNPACAGCPLRGTCFTFSQFKECEQKAPLQPELELEAAAPMR